MAPEIDQYALVCKRRFDEINRRFTEISDILARILSRFEGNGKLGFDVRVDRLEQAHAASSKFLWLLIGGGVASCITVAIKMLAA